MPFQWVTFWVAESVARETCEASLARDASHASRASGEPRSGEPAATNCTEHKLELCIEDMKKTAQHKLLRRVLRLSSLWQPPPVHTSAEAEAHPAVLAWKRLFVLFWNVDSSAAADSGAGATLHPQLHSSMLCDPRSKCNGAPWTQPSSAAAHQHHCSAIFPRVGDCTEPSACSAHFSQYLVHTLASDGDDANLGGDLTASKSDSLSGLLCKIVSIHAGAMTASAAAASGKSAKLFITSLMKCLPRTRASVSVDDAEIVRWESAAAAASRTAKSAASTARRGVTTHWALRASLELLLCLGGIALQQHLRDPSAATAAQSGRRAAAAISCSISYPRRFSSVGFA